MSTVLECILAVLFIVIIIVLVILTVNIVRFLKETTLTMTSIRELTDLTKSELKPALKSVNEVLATVNNVSRATNRQFDTVKKILTTVLGASCLAFGNVAKGKCGFFSGLLSGFNIFRKRR